MDHLLNGQIPDTFAGPMIVPAVSLSSTRTSPGGSTFTTICDSTKRSAAEHAGTYWRRIFSLCTLASRDSS